MPIIIQRSFTSGEISPSLQTRADLVKYSTGLNLCENFLVRAQGGVYSRPGFRYIDEVADSSEITRLIPFSFGAGQTYILVFNNTVMRVIKDDAYVLSGGTPYELATSYGVNTLPELDFAQSADVMTITQRGQVPKKLSRLADDNWTLTSINFANNTPVVVFPEQYVNTITNITQENPAVVTTAGSNLYLDGQLIKITSVVGMTQVNNRVFSINVLTATTFELRDEDSTSHTAYSSGGTATGEPKATTVGTGFGTNSKTYMYTVTAVSVDGVESLYEDELQVISNTLSETGGIKINWNRADNIDFYRIYKSISPNTTFYGWIGDSKTQSFEDYNLAPVTSIAPYDDRRVMNGAGNYHAAVVFQQQRKVFAGTSNDPQITHLSQTADYDSMRMSRVSRDDDAIEFTIAAQQVNEIRHLVSLDALLIFTSGGEWVVSEGQDRVITPSTIGVRAQSYNGSSYVKPVVVSNDVIYVQEKGNRVRNFGYNFNNGNDLNDDLSLMAEHLFLNYEIKDMAYSSEPYSIIWCVRSDGVLLGLTYQREHQVFAWHQHSTDGDFESVATITEGDRDAVYVVVKRTINGATKRYIERLESREETSSEDCFYVDSGLSYDGAAATVISGLSHLEGEDVAVLSDGNVVEGLTVSGGSITLPRAASKVHVGLSYTPAIELLDIDNVQSDVRSRSVSVSKVVIDVENSRGGWIGARQDGEIDATSTFYEIKPRFVSDSYDAITLKTYKAEVNIEPQWSQGGGVRIEQRVPLPLTILSVIPQVDLGGN